MDTNRKLTDKTGKKPRTPSYKYSFRLNEEQHIRFNEMLCKAGLEQNRSRFIVKRIFEEEFVVIRRDPRFMIQERKQFNFLVPYHRILSVILPIFL